MVKPRNTTIEPAEHEFGNCHTKIREFTTLEFSHIKKTTERRSRMMFSSGFDPSRNPKEGYQATHSNCVNYNRNYSSLLHGGPVDIYDKNVTVAEQLWESMHNIITFSSDMMRPFLAAMGVKTEDMSPFCRKFTSLRDLRNTFIRY